MIIPVVDKEGRIVKKEINRNLIIAAAIKELLLSHDNLYRSVFHGTSAKPHWDIAAKNARRVYEALVKDEMIPALTIESEFLKK